MKNSGGKGGVGGVRSRTEVRGDLGARAKGINGTGYGFRGWVRLWRTGGERRGHVRRKEVI